MSLSEQVANLLSAATTLCDEQIQRVGKSLEKAPDIHSNYSHEIQRCAQQWERAVGQLAYWTHRIELAKDFAEGKDDQNGNETE